MMNRPIRKLYRIKTAKGRVIPCYEDSLNLYLKVKGNKLLSDQEALKGSIVQPPSVKKLSLCPICGAKNLKTERELKEHLKEKHQIK